MRKLRTSVLALTTIASLTLGGTAVATAADDAPAANSSKNMTGSSKGEDQKGSAPQSGSSKGEDQKGSAPQSGSSKGEDQKGSAPQGGSSTKTEGDTASDKDNGGSLNRDKGWVPGHSFGSTLQTDYVPVWAKVWMAVVAVLGIVTAGLAAVPAMDALKHHLPSFR